jgi:hypothetical protein
MRFMNPWFRFRGMRWGWYVRFVDTGVSSKSQA